jgi:RNA-directed DNA polymerase
VCSQLFANIYLHDFDEAFIEDPNSPLRFANARLIRYADDLVVLAKHMGSRIVTWIENKLERALKLNINREKTKIVKLHKEHEELNFLGYTFRFDRDLKGRRLKYLNMFPAEKSVARIKEKIKVKTSSSSSSFILDVIEEVNEMLRGWSNYFKIGYPKMAFRDINYYLQVRFNRFMSNRSQRRLKMRKQGESLYTFLRRAGLQFL